ncbi:MAG: hypothetical protein BIFFINMI_02557 [Phycisphaerae bacterium]|nr:hypothetical protein [Phycisphaerae bacterium]
MRHRTALLVAAALLPAAVAVHAESIWVEGESCTDHNFTRNNWYDGVNNDALSGHDWLSHYDKARPGVATFKVAAGGGDYALWLRCNVLLASMDWRLDGGAWQTIDLRKDVRGEMMISPKPDHRNVGWVKVADVKLTAGSHAVAFRCNSKIANHGAIDCFVLTSDGFVPSGVRKPGTTWAAGPGDWFEAVFTDDAFSDKSVIDLSALTPAPAGAAGFLHRDGDALRFERAGTPTRFWGCGANANPRETHEQMTRRARYLRKYGVNMVRQHSVFELLGPLRNGAFDAAKLDVLDHWFATLKAQGIYSTWSVFYPLRIDTNDGYPADLFAELDKGSTSGLVNFMPQLQDLQWRYVKALLEHVNPYTKLRYLDDPALAVVEVQNEDCVFWHWPLNDLTNPRGRMPRHAAELRRQFAEWLKAHGQDPSQTRMFGAWQFKGDKPDAAMGRFIHFLADTQRGFYLRREKQLRLLGFKGVTVTTAWRAGGPAADPANLWCDAAMDMIDRHNYFGGGEGGHSIKAGKVFNGTQLATPGGGMLTSGLYQVADRPFSITEWTSKPPNQYKAEAAPLFAFYGMGLNGWDASYHFLNSRTGVGDGWPNLSSYVTDTPAYIGQFPALAFAIHKGHVKEGPAVAIRRLATADLFTGRDPLAQDLIGAGDEKGASDGTSTQLLAIGRVLTSFDGGKSERMDVDKYWDSNERIVRSATGQLAWDYGRRVVTVSTGRTAAVVGFAGGQSFDLAGAKVTVKTDFVSLILTPLDDRPLAESKNILITAMARDTQTGAKYSPDGRTLLSVGAPPLLMEPVQATIALAGDRPAAVNVLDLYGVPTGRTVKPAHDGSFAIDGTHRTFYYQVTR